MAASISSISGPAETTIPISTPPLIDQIQRLVEGFNEGTVSLEDAQTQGTSYITTLRALLVQPRHGPQTARQGFAELLLLRVPKVPNVASKKLLHLLSPETIAYDLTHSQAPHLLTLEATLCSAIDLALRKGVKSTKFLVRLLSLYEDTLEHLFLLAYKSEDPTTHTTIITNGMPEILTKATQMLDLLERVVTHSESLRHKHRAIKLSLRRLATPLNNHHQEELKKLISSLPSPYFLAMLGQFYENLRDASRAIYQYERALEKIEGLISAIPGLKKRSGESLREPREYLHSPWRIPKSD